MSEFQKEILTLLLKGFTTKNLEEIFLIPKQKLVKEYYHILNNRRHLLTSEEYAIIYQAYLDNYSFKDFSNEKIIFIADTHIGSKNENLEYLRQVKDFIKQNKFKYLIHAGDLGDGMVNYHRKVSTYPKQIEHILANYDLGEDIYQYILGGNHDKKYQKRSKDILQLLREQKPNIENIGYYQAYFTINALPISLEHGSHQNQIFVNPSFRILGHAHYLKFKESSLILPPLCDGFPNKEIYGEPGFVTLESSKDDKDVILDFTSYGITENGPEQSLNRIYTLKPKMSKKVDLSK